MLKAALKALLPRFIDLLAQVKTACAAPPPLQNAKSQCRAPPPMSGSPCRTTLAGQLEKAAGIQQRTLLLYLEGDWEALQALSGQLRPHNDRHMASHEMTS